MNEASCFQPLLVGSFKEALQGKQAVILCSNRPSAQAWRQHEEMEVPEWYGSESCVA